MLVLSRRKLEAVVFPDLGIEVTVIEIRGDKVRLGINAPRDVTVHRSEVQAAIDSQEAAEKEQRPAVDPPSSLVLAGKAD